MTITKVKEAIKGEILNLHHDAERIALTGCGSDLMSDVLAFMKERGVLLTGLMNPQVVRTAEMMDICAIVFVRGKKPDESIVELATEKNIILLTTNYSLFTACGKLWEAGLRGIHK